MRPDRTSTTKTLMVFTSRAIALSGLPKLPARPTKLIAAIIGWQWKEPKLVN